MALDLLPGLNWAPSADLRFRNIQSLRLLVSTVLFFLLVCSRVCDLHTASVQNDMKMVIDRLMINYTKQVSPNGDQPTVVELGIYINSFDSISEQTMDYSVNIYMRQQWYDQRLQFDRNEVAGRELIKLEDQMWEKIWVPDVFFRNEKKANFHYVTIPNRLIRLYSDGRLWYASKISATLSCMMNLQKYPLDTQTCPMMLESFGYTTETVIFKWLNNSIEREPNLSMPQFILQDTKVSYCTQNYTTGAYPCLQVNFILQRDIVYFLIQIYVPTTLIVILSWVAFWINIEAIPARVSLGLLTVLAMTTQSTTGSQLPRVSYVKAIDVWMSVCLIFVFASLLEFAIVNVYSRRSNSRGRLSRKRKMATAAANQYQEHLHYSNNQHKPLLGAFTVPIENIKTPEPEPGGMCPEGKLKARKIDKISRRLFPLVFLLFNTVYWVMYVIVMK